MLLDRGNSGVILTHAATFQLTLIAFFRQSLNNKKSLPHLIALSRSGDYNKIYLRPGILFCLIFAVAAVGFFVFVSFLSFNLKNIKKITKLNVTAASSAGIVCLF